jgi:hypothetical protein
LRPSSGGVADVLVEKPRAFALSSAERGFGFDMEGASEEKSGDHGGAQLPSHRAEARVQRRRDRDRYEAVVVDVVEEVFASSRSRGTRRRSRALPDGKPLRSSGEAAFSASSSLSISRSSR